MRSKSRIDFRWRYAPRTELDKELLQYIKQHSVLSLTEMILKALRAFWLPMAITHSPNYDIATKQRIVSECVDTLLRQANSLCALVGLEFFVRGREISPKNLSFNPTTKLEQPVEVASRAMSATPISPLTVSELAAAAGGGDFDDSGLSEW